MNRIQDVISHSQSSHYLSAGIPQRSHLSHQSSRCTRSLLYASLRLNFFTHCVNLIMITPCLSRTIHLFLVHHYHILSHLPLSHCPSLLLCFTLGLKLTPSINTSHRKYLVPIGLPFPDFTTASCVFSQAHRFLFFFPVMFINFFWF